MKKGRRNIVFKAVFIFAAVAAAAGVICFGKYEYAKKYKISEIDSSVSADGSYVLLFQSIGEADWPFGASHAGLVLKHNGKAVTQYRFDVANDGKNLCADNWQVNWKEHSAEVLILGEEQKEVRYSLGFDGDVRILSDNELP